MRTPVWFCYYIRILLLKNYVCGVRGAARATEVRGFTLALTYNMKYATVVAQNNTFGEFIITWEVIVYNGTWKKQNRSVYAMCMEPYMHRKKIWRKYNKIVVMAIFGKCLWVTFVFFKTVCIFCCLFSTMNIYYFNQRKCIF